MAAKFDEIIDNSNNKNNEASSINNEIINCWSQLKHRPKCIVFDLDYTLWPYLCDADIIPPFRRKVIVEDEKERVVIVDNRNKIVGHFQEVGTILKSLKEICFKQMKFKYYLAIASKATTRDVAVELMRLFGWVNYFDSIQVHSGSKTKHMKTIVNELKLKSFSQILFFDDNKSNIVQTETLGLVAHQLNRSYGLNVNEFIKGLNRYDSTISKNLIQTAKVA